MHGAARAVLKLIGIVAMRCREWHSFQESGTWMQGGESSGIGVGIKIGFKALMRT